MKMTIFNRKSITKAISFILALILIATFVPTVLYAKAIEVAQDITVGKDAADTTASSTDESTQSIYGVNGGIYEVEDLREENTKHFHLEDGTYVAAQYDYPVHTLDENGKWVDINNRLEDSGSSYSTENEKIKFEKKINGSEKLLTLKDGNTKITLSLIGAAKGTVAEVTNGEDDAGLTELQKYMNLENISSKIIYRDALDGVDIEYIIKSNDVKENIIVKEKQETYSYTFDLKLNGMTATLTNAGDISISDANGEKYIIPAPIVYDAAITTVPEGAAYFTLNGREGRYALTITVDAEWMNADERLFPVTVDPTITFAGGKTIDYASYEGEALNEKYINYPLMVVGNGINALWKTNAIVNVNSSAYIHGVTLHIPYHSSEGRFFPVLALSEVTSEWTPNEIFATNERPTVGDTVSESTVNFYSGIGYVYDFDITELAAKWYNRPRVNYGVQITNTGKGCFGLIPTVRLNPVGYVGNTTYASPTFTVEYAQMSGVEGYWTSASHSAGLAGVGTVNHANGALNLVIPLGSTMDSIMPYTVSMIYESSRYSDLFNFLGAAGAAMMSYLPRGMMLNINESIIKSTDNNYYRYLDSDGTVHNMYTNGEITADGDQIYVDNDGLQKVLKVGNGKITITDDSKITKTFLPMPASYCEPNNEIWYLNKITDEIGNEVIMSYDSSYKPLGVSFKPYNMAEIAYLSFVYSSNGRLIGVFNEVSREATVISYTSEGRLYGFEFVKCSVIATANDILTYYTTGDDTNVESLASARYYYDTYGRMIIANDNLADQSIRYEWYNLSVSKISHYAGDTLGQQLEFRYGTGYTDVVQTGNDEVLGTDDDIVSRYVFDDRGRTVSAYSFAENNSVIYGGTVGVYETHESVKNNLKEQTTIGGTNVNLLLNGDFEDVYLANGTTYVSYWNTYGSVTADNNTNLEANGGGLYSAKLSPTATATASITQFLRLTNGVYTLSFMSSCAESTNVAAQIRIQSSSGVLVHEDIYGSQKGEVQAHPYYSKTFEITEDDGLGVAIEISITVNCKDSTKYNSYIDYILVDSVSLEEGAGASQLSKVEYGGFSKLSFPQTGADDSDVAELWHIAANDDSVNIAFLENSAFDNVLKIDSNGTGYAWQRIFEYTPQPGNVGTEFNPNINANMQFVISAYAQTTDALANGIFRIRVNVAYYQGEGVDDVVIPHCYDFVPSCNGWQFTGGRLDTAFEADNSEDTNDYSCVRYIDVYCEFSGSMGGYALFDNISVVCDIDNTTEYYYYTEGTLDGLLAKTSSRYYTEMYEYDDQRRLTVVRNNNKKMTEYHYGENGLVEYEVYSDYDYDGVLLGTPITQTDYKHNNFGQVTETITYEACYNENNTEIVAKNGTNYVITKNEYYIGSEDKAYFGAIKKQTNGIDRSSLYFYDGTHGYLLATVDECSGTGTAYSYDYMGNLATVLPVSYSEEIYTEITNAHSVSYLYDSNNRLSSVMTDSTVYNFTYDAFGNSTAVQVGSNTIASYEYYENNGKLKKVIYANGFVVKYVYNTLEKISEVWYNYSNGSEQLAYSYEYTANGVVYKETDYILDRETVYKYDDFGRLLTVSSYDGGTNVHEVHYLYDEKSRVSAIYQRIDYAVGTETKVADIQNKLYYNEDNRLDRDVVQTSGHKTTVYYTYDDFGRVTLTESFSGNGTGLSTAKIITSYEYREFGTSQTDSLIEKATTTVNGATSEEYYIDYDNRGYITRITYNTGASIEYMYDDLGQLVREDNERLGETYVYTYDNAGNILFKYVYDYTIAANPTGFTSKIQYVYDNAQWGDLLTYYNGQNITYDLIGNPLQYYNGFSFTWDGRQMKTAAKNGSTFIFAYNEDGLRSIKANLTCASTNYYYHNGLLIAEETNGDIFIYHYTSGGSIIGMSHRKASYAEGVWDTYVFEKNISGDIVAVYDLTGNKLVSYTYDAWGNFTTTYHNGTTANSVAARNPFRYRSYYYDADLQLYYLQTRYYDSVTGRFINADGYVSTGQGMLGNNMFAYCNNNPVMFVDPTGEMSKGVAIALGILAYVVAGPGGAIIVHDIYQLSESKGQTTKEEAGDNLGYTINSDGDIEIHNSYKVLTPWMQYAYSFYLNHFNDSTKEEIKGTTTGVRYEWMLHNAAYMLTGSDSAKSVNIGYTIFHDNHGWMSVVMGITYVSSVGLLYSITDAIVYACN